MPREAGCLADITNELTAEQGWGQVSQLPSCLALLLAPLSAALLAIPKVLVKMNPLENGPLG